MNNAFLRRLAAWFRRDRLDDQLRDEMSLHIELRRQQLIDDGMDPREAEYAARRSFGNVTAIREETRSLWGTAILDMVVQDLRYGLRVLAKSRGFTAVAVLSLAVGIGASTVVFSFANAFVLRPLSAANPSTLMEVFTSGSSGSRYGASSYPDYEDFRDRTGIFSGLMATMRATATLSDADRPDLIEGVLVCDGYFEVLGLRPSRGRFFSPEENRTPLTHPVLVLSHDSWVRRFGSDPSIVGRIVGLSGHAFTVIGVGPPNFAGTSFDHAADFFVPVMMQRAIAPDSDVMRNRRARAFRLYGRLKDGITPGHANAALGLLAAQLFQHEPAAWTDRTGRSRVVTILPELKARFAGSGPGTVFGILSSVIAAVTGLLTIACVNVATVLLGRAP